MTKLFTSLRLALLATVSVTSLASCQLYFGNEDDVGPGVEPGFPCAANAECAAGCYCSDAGVCEEAGFCATDADCPPNHVCDERNSCVPNTCGTNADCGTGAICQDGACVNTCTCTSDSEAQDKLNTADAHCDEGSETCIPGADPAGLCNSEITCNERPPSCPVGEVPLVLDGCYTTLCRAIAQCEGAPACEAIQHFEDCAPRADPAGSNDCQVVATGTNCTTPGGGLCQPGDTNCTCQNFQFHSCATKASGLVPENP